MTGVHPWLTATLTVVYVMLSLALALAFVRLVRGPSLPDRVVALDLVTTVAIGLISAYAVDTGERIFLDAAIALALLAFLGTVAFARYLEVRARDDRGV